MSGTKSPPRRALGLHRIVWIGALATLIVACGSAQTDERASEVLARVQAAKANRAFSFRHRPLDPAPESCLTAPATVDGVVDQDSGLVDLRLPSIDGARTIRSHQELYISAPVAPLWSAGSTWLKARMPIDPRVLTELKQVLGPTVSSFVLADSLPSDGNQTIAALAPVASSVSYVASERLNSVEVDRIRVETDANKLTEASSQPGRVRLDAWVGRDGFVLQIEAHMMRDSEPGYGAIGYQTTFVRPAERPAGPVPESAVDLASLPQELLARNPTDGSCSVDIGR